MKDKYTFRREYTDLYGQTSVVEHTVEGETLDEIMMTFLYFLNGCSYSYVKDLIFVKEDGQEVSVTDWDSSIYNPQNAEELDGEIDQLSLVLENIEKSNNALD